MKKVAVIMPAYNASKYIEASVLSVLGQSHRELCLIVADDGSSDETPAILERLREGDGRLQILRLQNGGPARARNAALELLPEDADYVMFADADDLLESDAIEYALAHAAGAELALMGFRIDNSDGSSARYYEPEQLLSSEEIGASLGRLYKANLLNQVWAKLFSAQLIRENSIRFPDYRWGEDRLFMFECLSRCKSLAVLPECKYIYIMHKGESLISRYYDKKFDVCLEVEGRMAELCRQLGAEDERECKYMFVKSVFSCLTTLYAPSCPLKRTEKRAEIRRIIKNERLAIPSSEIFGGISVRLPCAVIRSGSVTLNAVVFWLLSRLGTVAPKLFTMIKHKK